MEGLSRILSQKHADAILLDSYVAGYHQGLLTQYNLADIMERVLSYGVLLNRQGTWLEHCGRNYVEMYRDVIFRKISSSIKPLKVRIFQGFFNERDDHSTTHISML